ncbi:hypothetical protein [Reichenbachiella versicolor]|uniref:hypothetical protein n=1 Tax=Reichenbachiella versicolor TaxID=1821036 RepID=UPI000D6DD53A|nr:hypothetical protein [Reichenbachiella versicolor]
MNLHEIDAEIDLYKDKIDNEISKVNLRIFDEFKLAQFSKLNVNELNFPGIYLFEIDMGVPDSFDEWSSEFLERWQDDEYRRNFTPNSRKIRLDYHRENTLSGWLPLYLGRSKDIGRRVHSHLNIELKKPTTALKLLARKNMYKERFRLRFLKVAVNNYDFIMPYVEMKLRDRFNPILGRQ